MFIHTDEGKLNGTFESPNYGNGEYAPNLQCIYSFVAQPNYRVELVFDDFALTTSAATCDGDYIDIYSELPNPNVSLIDEELSGRYCGTVSPPKRVSLYHAIVLVFHTHSKSAGQRGFHGRFRFKPANEYLVGTPAAPGVCGFDIDQADKKRGIILSPTYPGAYPRNFKCFYRLRGVPGQRIQLYFEDFDIYFGGEHCPYDAVTIYDGESANGPIIRKICGIQQKLVIYSRAEALYLDFRTFNPPHTEHRGFKLQYVFSRKFVDVDKLIGGQSGVSHLRGSECDVRVRSNRETSHVITSPNYPHQYPQNTTCTYILDGLQGAQDLEKVILEFRAFSIASRIGDNSSGTDVCPDDWLEINFSGKVPDPSKREEDEGESEVFCKANPPSKDHPYETGGPRMVLTFHSADQVHARNSRHQRFKALVRFKTDYGIIGKPRNGNATHKCQFDFDSLNSMHGFYFNSPRYPSNYPQRTTCIYYLNGKVGERVRIHLEQFALHNVLSEDKRCGDWLELYDVFEDGTEKMIKRYCSKTFPGPIVSSYNANRIRVVFSSDEDGTATGFKANFDFFPRAKQEIPDYSPHGCGGRISSGLGGWIASPGYPTRYVKNLTCFWEVNVSKGNRIRLQPIEMKVEGEINQNEDGSSCSQAVIRVYTKPGSEFSKEFCGTKENVMRSIMSQENYLRISFLTSPDKVNGLKGFNFSWTEIFNKQPGKGCADQGMFECRNTDSWCIDESLRCNGAPNCGYSDMDESQCESAEKSDNKTLILAAAGTGLLLVAATVIGCVLCRRRGAAHKPRRHHRHHHTHFHSSYKAPLDMDDAHLSL